MLSEKDVIGNAKRNALKLMKDSGFEITDKLEVVVDSALPFMGYSTKRSGGHVIVVSGMALKSGPVEGLLIHEMCHVYRTKTNHPSHNSELLNTVGHAVIHKNQLTEDYQLDTIRQAVNHIQDLYADDIAFKVFQRGNVFTPEQAFVFFLDWINDTPLPSKTEKDRWLNIEIMLNNCFALSNMTRHNVKDIDNKAEKRAQKFLSQVNALMKKEFPHLQQFMTNLKEDPTETQFKKDLIEYLTRIIELAKQTHT